MSTKQTEVSPKPKKKAVAVNPAENERPRLLTVVEAVTGIIGLGLVLLGAFFGLLWMVNAQQEAGYMIQFGTAFSAIFTAFTLIPGLFLIALVVASRTFIRKGRYLLPKWAGSVTLVVLAVLMIVLFMQIMY